MTASVTWHTMYNWNLHSEVVKPEAEFISQPKHSSTSLAFSELIHILLCCECYSSQPRIYQGLSAPRHFVLFPVCQGVESKQQNLICHKPNFYAVTIAAFCFTTAIIRRIFGITFQTATLISTDRSSPWYSDMLNITNPKYNLFSTCTSPFISSESRASQDLRQ